MVYASSISSNEQAKVSSKIRNMGKSQRPQIHISLNGAEDSWVMTYSTLDRIEGVVSITCPINTLVDDLQINFLGTTKTFLERLSSSTAISGRTEAFHQFLKLAQPIPQSAWPEGRLLEAGKTYKFNFLFVVPQQLLPRVCRHAVSSSTVQQEHLNLPPSLGDKQVAGRGNTLLDDFSPDMARIKYAIVATLQEAAPEGFSQQPIIKAKKVRILPASDEKPPLSVDGPDSEYALRAEKDIRRGVFKGKTGRLVASASQPKSIRIPSYKSPSDSAAPESTVVTVNLRFDPADDRAAPPKLGNLSTKFKISSFFSSSARARLPSKRDIQWDLNQGVHSETISLATRCVANVEWVSHSGPSGSRPASPDSLQRRSSTVSAASTASISTPDASAKYQGGAYYTAQVLVPVSLPATKAWIPTFHTCLISRIYSLSLHLTVHGGGGGVGLGAGLDLKLPVQISSEGNPEAIAERRRESLAEEEMAVEALEADEFFAPRTVRPVDERFVGRSSIGQMGSAGMERELPPGYDDFPRQARRMPTAVV